MKAKVTKRTKSDVAETLDELYRTTLATKGRSRDGYLLARGAEAAMCVAAGYARGGYDSSEYNDIAEVVSSLSAHLRAAKMNIDLYDGHGIVPWKEGDTCR